MANSTNIVIYYGDPAIAVDLTKPNANQPSATTNPKPNSKFPSLEDQKLADLAYKRLGLELENLNDTDLKRVKDLGYEGGVKVVGLSGSVSMQGAMGANDILVGLHAWPTTSLKDISQILNRDDFAELIPLKYYVIHQQTGFGGAGPDEVQTGRISVNMDGVGRPTPTTYQSTDAGSDPSLRPTQNQPTLVPSTSIEPHHELAAQSTSPNPAEKSVVTPGAAAGANPYDTSLRPVTVYSTLPGPPPTLNAPAAKDSHDPFAVPGSGSANAAISDGWGEAKLGAARPSTTASTAPRQSTNCGMVLIHLRHRVSHLARRRRRLWRRPFLVRRWWRPFLEGLSRHGRLLLTPLKNLTDPKTRLRYNGMSFDEWRTRWQTELSSEKRTEAVNALAAFARAGFGKEAVDAILDVAGEYDFQTIDGTAEGKLKQTVIAELVTNQRNAPLAKYWLPEIIARTEKEPVKWKWLASQLISQLRTDDEAVLKELRALAASDKSPLRSDALACDHRIRRKINDADHKLIDDALQSDDSNVVRSDAAGC